MAAQWGGIIDFGWSDEGVVVTTTLFGLRLIALRHRKKAMCHLILCGDYCQPQT
jgi:hypothetical protein